MRAHDVVNTARSDAGVPVLINCCRDRDASSPRACIRGHRPYSARFACRLIKAYILARVILQGVLDFGDRFKLPENSTTIVEGSQTPRPGSR